MKITSGDIVLTIVLILFIAAMITFSGCSQPEPIEPNTPGFVSYEIDGDRVRLYIDSDAPSVSVSFDKGYIYTINQRFYQCNSWPYVPGRVIDVWSDTEFCRLNP